MVNIHLRRCAGCTPRKLSGKDGEAISGSNRAHQTPHHLSCSDLGRAQNAGPTEPVPLRTTECLSLSGLDLGDACNPGPASDSSRQSNLSLSSVGREGARAVSRGRPSVTEALQAHASVICLQLPSLPTVRLNR